MAIQEVSFNKVKAEATKSIARAKARQAQVVANSHVLKAKQMINRSQAQAKK